LSGFLLRSSNGFTPGAAISSGIGYSVAGL
jgi:hypothetical protein